MPDYLLASEWKKTVKNHPDVKGLDDLTRTLDQYAKSQESPAKERVALKAVTTRAKELKSKNAKNKGLADALDDVLEAAEKAERAAEKAEAEDKKKEKEEEEEEGETRDADLIKQLAAARTADRVKARHFVIALGKPAGVAIAKVPVSRKHKDHARSYRKGKGKLLIGLCYGDGGKYVFELEDKPPGGLAKLLKKAVKLQADRDIKVMVRGGGVDIDDENDLDEVADLGEDAPDEPDPVGTAVEEEEKEKEKEQEQEVGDRAALEAELKRLLQKAAGLGLAPEVLRDVKLLASETNLLIRKNELTAAGERLGVLKQKIEPTTGPTPSGNGAEADPRIVARAVTLAKQLDALDGDAVGPLRALLAEARAAAGEGRAVDAEEALDRVEARARGLARAAEVAREIAAAGPTRTVGFKVAREGWNQARQLARAQMAKFSNAVLADPEARAQPDWPDIEAGAGELVAMLDVFDDSLAQAIEQAETATDPAQIRAGLQEAARLISDYREELATNPVYGVMDNGSYGTFKVHALMTKSLDQAAAKLGV